jgi:predicted Zn-ribbon and HTH transcriptional regulator
MAVHQTLSEAQDPISAMSRIKSPALARAFLALSLREIAEKITDTTSNDLHHVSRSWWCDAEHGRRVLKTDQVRQVESILAEALMNELAYDAMLSEVTRRFAVRIKVGRTGTWTTRVFTTCVKCGRAYHITRIASKRCPRCIKKSKGVKHVAAN